MFLLGIVLAILLAKLSGGKLKNLGQVDFHKLSVIVIVLFIVDLFLRIFIGNSNSDFSLFLFNIYPYYTLIMYLGIIIVLELNKYLKYFRIIEGGFILNYLPMVLNGGKMPVSKDALAKLGLNETIQVLDRGLSMTHSLIGPDTNFKVLADIIAIPFPFKIVISLGDIFIFVGLILFIVYYSKNKGEGR